MIECSYNGEVAFYPVAASDKERVHYMAISEAQRKAVAKFNAANYDRVELRLPKGKKQELKEHAESRGETLNGFVNRAILEAIARDNNG